MKRFLALFLALLLGLSCMTACDNSTEEETQETTEIVSDTESDTDETEGELDMTPKIHRITSKTEGVKVLGVRNQASETSLRMDWSCSGAEFGINLYGGDVKLKFSLEDNKPCLIRVWVDGWDYLENDDPFIEVNSLGVVTLKDIPAGEHVIRIVKLTGWVLSRIELTSVTFAGTLMTDREVKDKDLYFEFIGDSITCGYGVLDFKDQNNGTYKGQDGMQAYSYLLAEEFDADYSMLAMSGYRLVEHFIQKDALGNLSNKSFYLKATPNGDMYNFERKADLVVINLGTNDVASGNPKIDRAQFEDYYYTLLQTVREKNGPDCKILCVYNAAYNDCYETNIKNAVSRFGGADAGVITFKLERDDGGHPTAAYHASYANVLKPVIADLLGS